MATRRLPEMTPSHAADDASLHAMTDRPRQMPLDLGHTPSLSEADFMVSDCNRLAFEHVRAFPNWPALFTLVIGPPKSGKSHLARIWIEQAGALAPASGELEALAATGGREPVVIEDADRRGYDEHALFHLLNQSMRESRPVFVTARTPVVEWPYKTDDVRSRMRLAQCFVLDPPDDILLSQMFVKLFGDRQVAVDPRTVAYLVARMERSPAEVVALVGLVDHLALSNRRPITRALASEALALRAASRGRDSQDE